MKKVLLLFAIFFSLKSFSQKDSIVNFLDKNGSITKNKQEAHSFEIITKKAGSLWFVRSYNRNGKIFRQGHYKNKNLKKPLGQFITYFKNGKPSHIEHYDLKGHKKGKTEGWFHNGNKNYEGIYDGNKKEGVWKYYHFTGGLASRVYYKNDSVLKVIEIDDRGGQKKYREAQNKKAQFKGGKKKFAEKIKKLSKSINYTVKGKVHVSFFVGIDGKISDVEIDEKLPEMLHNQIVNYFKSIKGWSPAENFHRKHPVYYSIPLNFRS
ncbi:MORN repeat protein [Tenacibaculum adriaticum]|uniref:MORN repeat protein n=1 Tax=Tenacibaculum adriaticum TaxID=413713 RepID=A0A5S5DQ05_9FLAO|nr:energy transducer TonB [Tenacibaculum adriaticum]TYP96769.1 MORN repeat protein [Tenacibaculum adriaticum]